MKTDPKLGSRLPLAAHRQMSLKSSGSQQPQIKAFRQIRHGGSLKGTLMVRIVARCLTFSSTRT